MPMNYELRGLPPDDFIPLSVPVLCGNEWNYIRECLDTGWVSSAGPFVQRFEDELASVLGARYAVATTTGTAALHVALRAIGVGPDDEVLVSALTFIAPANAVRYVGAWPVFMDADPYTWQMDPAKVVEFVERACVWANGQLHNRESHRRVRAILPVHILGHPVDLDPILEVAQKYDLFVVEDATESLGSRYKDRSVGLLGHIACFSFNGNKLITSGGGGMVVTQSEEMARKVRYLSTQAKDDPVEYIHREIGYNYRLTNLQASLGLAQLERLQQFVSAKRRIARLYQESLSGVVEVTPMNEASWARSTYWLYTVLVDPDRCVINSRSLIRKLAESRIQSRPLWQPLHRSPAHCEAQAYHVEVADQLYRDAVSLPSSVNLQEKDLCRVVSSVLNAVQGLRG